MVATQETIDKVKEVSSTYKYGFVTDLEAEKAPLGLSEDIVKYISHKKKEPKWLLEWRLKAYKKWLTMEAPNWAMVDFPEINFQDIYTQTKYFLVSKVVTTLKVRHCQWPYMS